MALQALLAAAGPTLAAAAPYVSAGLSFLGGQKANSARASQADDLNKFNRDMSLEQRWFQSKQTAKGFQFNRQEAVKNRRFQRRMSDTSYQRAVKDLRKAKINPMLAARFGGASSPGGSAASASALGSAFRS